VTSFSDGITANITYTLGAVSFIGEYLGALSSFNDPIFNGSEPSATNLEIDYNFTTFGKATTFIAAYQTTNQSLALELPEAKFLLGLGIDFNEHLSVSLEYSKAKDYGINDGGTGEKVDTYIAQVAASF